MSWPCPPLHAELPCPPGTGSGRPARCQAHACRGRSQVGAGCQARFPPCTVAQGGTMLPVALAGGLCWWWGQLGVGQKGWVHRTETEFANLGVTRPGPWQMASRHLVLPEMARGPRRPRVRVRETRGGSGAPGPSTPRRLWGLGPIPRRRLWGLGACPPRRGSAGLGAHPPAAPLVAPSCGLERPSPTGAPGGKAGRPSRSRRWGRFLCRRRCRLEGCGWLLASAFLSAFPLSLLQDELLFQPQTCCESSGAPGLEWFRFSGLIAGRSFSALGPRGVHWRPGPGFQIQRHSWPQSVEGRGRSLTRCRET